MNLLFAINHHFVPLLCSCLGSIICSGGEAHYDAYIIHSDLTSKDQEQIGAAVGTAITCHYIQVDDTLFAGFPESSRYPRQIYYRLAAPLMLPEHLNRILYLDVDLVVINPLRELYGMDFEGNYYIACSHVRRFLTKFNQVRLGVEEDVPYINTGVLLMDLESLREDLSFEKLLTAAEETMHTCLLPDQDILTVLYGDKIRLADTLRFNLSDRILSIYNADPRHEKRDLNWVRQNAVIIHYCGKNRPWKEHYNGILDVFYREAVDEVSRR